MKSMTPLQNLRVGARLAVSFGVIVALILAMAAFNAFETAKVRSMAAEEAQAQAERLSLAQEWRFNVGMNAQRALAIALSSGAKMANFFEADMKRVSAASIIQQQRFAEVETTPEGIRLLKELEGHRTLYRSMRETLVKAGKTGDDATINKIAPDFKPAVERYIAAVDALVHLEQDRQLALSAEVANKVDFMQRAGMAITAACVLAAVLLCWRLTRSIVGPLGLAQSTADRIAGGDLSVDLHATGRDEVGRLTESLGRMQESLRTLVGGIRLSAETIGVASAEVATGNHDLSARTEQAAASLQRTASSVEQLSSTVRQSADSARQADALAQQASEVASRGGAAVVSVVHTMERIQESSSRIADIIGTIDSIAFQTNILALNAAVEAARAGEQGRGFAVVASEVRTLAQRSATAAKEIKALIGESVDRVESGSQQAQAAGATLADLVESVKRVAGIIGEISSASAEQATGIGEINQAVAHLDQATQQNAALVEESAAAASSLKDQAGTLAQSIQRFQLVG